MVAELIPVLVMPKNGHDKARRNTFDFSKASTALDFSYAIPPLVWPSPSNEDFNF